MTDSPQSKPEQTERARWRAVIEEHQQPSTGRALWQIINTVVPYLLLWLLMYWLKDISLWLTIPFAVVTGAFLVRVFIILHDCGHGSFLRSRKANDILGRVAGVLTFTPYHHWRWQHAIHHRTSGHLDKRGDGDIWTMTAQEYLESSRWKRFAYRLARNPFVLFVLAPMFVFIIQLRFASGRAGNRERHSVAWTNLVLVFMVVGMSTLFGIGPYLLIQAIALMVAGAAGIWLFYIQHQFENVYWERGENWDHVAAALKGSSFYKLPRVLQWFSGNIGFHHIHHLSPRVPNYHLQKCHEADPVFQQVQPITLMSSLRSMALHLWDEQAGRLVGYARLKQLRLEQQLQNSAPHQQPE